MMFGRRWVLACLGAALAASSLPAAQPAAAEASRIRLSRGYGTGYLPLMIMQDGKLIEKHAEKNGLGKVTVEWSALDGGNIINDAMLAGSLDIAGIGVPGFITLWSKARNIPAAAVIGVSGLSGGALWLNTNKASIKTLRDFGPADKIAVPGIKTSFAAFALQMAAAKEFGIENFAKLDPLTVGLPHPDAYAALSSGKTEITAHFASAPFSYKELEDPKIHRVLTTRDSIGPVSLLMTFAPKRFVDANPKLIAAVLAAQAEANELVNRDKEKAAEIYVRVSGVRMSHDDLIRMLTDPENTFSSAPEGMMQYADFMTRAGIIKSKPSAWTDMFVADLHRLPGS